MFEKIAVALFAALVCALLYYVLQRLVLTPVRPGKNTAQQIVLHVRGREPALENHVAGLLWLGDCGVLRCRVHIVGWGLDQETRTVARLLERDHERVTFTEEEEVPEWISEGSL